MAVYAVCRRRAAASCGSAGETLFNLCYGGYGALVMLVLALLTDASFAIEQTPAYIGSLLYLAVIGSIVGFATYFSLVGRIGAGPAAYTTVMFPLIALGMSTLFEGDQWSGAAVFGLVLILIGNVVMFYQPRAGRVAET